MGPSQKKEEIQNYYNYYHSTVNDIFYVLKYYKQLKISIYIVNYNYTWFFENRATKTCQSLALIGNLMALVT